jgi:hypothetical protein
MQVLRTLFALTVAAALTGCGSIAPLKPPAGQSLPVKPLMARATPTAEELLTPPAYANPERIDELMKRSQPRTSARFDLPPPDGGAAPLPPTQEPSSSEEAGPATPL